ncbi:signal peptidase I [bacterium]|nr:MAG: signal peptidase I [bacterium]
MKLGPDVARIGGAEIRSKGRRRVRGFTVFLFIVLILAVFGLLNFRTVEVKGISMLPTLTENRKVLVSHAFWLVGPVKREDIVVLREADGTGYFIKRVKGLPGDEIEWTFKPRDVSIASGPYHVPPGMIYVLGDNLAHSTDSRVIGPVPMDRILGKVLVAR